MESQIEWLFEGSRIRRKARTAFRILSVEGRQLNSLFEQLSRVFERRQLYSLFGGLSEVFEGRLVQPFEGYQGSPKEGSRAAFSEDIRVLRRKAVVQPFSKNCQRSLKEGSRAAFSKDYQGSSEGRHSYGLSEELSIE